MKTMNQRKNKHPKLSMRLFFIIFIILELLLVDVLSTAAIALLSHYSLVIGSFAKSISLVIISVVMGSTITTFIATYFLNPMLKLGVAMRKVAQGDFSVTLPTTHMFPEIRQINQDFNLMARELESTEILKTEFVSNVSHEFKTPITAIEGYATLLQGSDEPENSEQEKYIQKILFNTNRLSKLVGNILLLSKVDSQEIQSKLSTYRLDEQIRQAILSLESKWMTKGNDFDVDLERIEYTGNENLLMHVWTNLIENAIKYGPDNGLISLKLQKEKESILFTIEDEGPGIPSDALKHIFDRFYQADSSRKAEGNGLGLALVKQILSVSDGEISAENLPEKGTRFTVRLYI